MKWIDLTGDTRIGALLEQLRALGAAEPRQALEGLIDAMRFTNRPAYAEVVVGENNSYSIVRLRSDEGTDLLPQGPISGVAGGFIGQLITSPSLKLLAEINLEVDPVLLPLRDYRSAAAVPILMEHSAPEWVILFSREQEGFRTEHLEDLLLRATLVGAISGNLQMARRLFEANLRIQAEINQIAEIQKALLPAQLPEVPGLSVAANYEAMGDAGGDLYDIVPMHVAPALEAEAPQELWGMMIGDVAGHGPAAAIVMAMLHSIIHAYPTSPKGPGEVLAHANKHLCDKRIGGAFATAFLAFYEPATRMLTYARAGHNPPLLIGADGNMRYLDAIGDLPLGITDEGPFEECRIKLEPGQALVMYTDGIVEARNGKGDMFDLRKLENALTPLPESAEGIVRRIRHALISFRGHSSRDDDQTIVVAKVA